jgi:hypothetical protein
MKKSMLRMVVSASLLGCFALGMAGCAHTHREGPMERAGRHTDDAARDVKHGAKKAADDVKND